jgi:hypothetical protein
MIQEIEDSDFAEVTVIIKKESPSESVSGRTVTGREKVIHGLYSRWDERTEPPYPDPLEPVNLAAYLSRFRLESVVPLRNGKKDLLRQSDIERLGEYDLDVLIDLGTTKTRGTTLALARYGIWSYEPSEKVRERGGPPGFWEVVYGEVITELNLVMFTRSHPEGVTLTRCTTSTDLLSVKANRCKHFWKAAFSLPRKLREIYLTQPGMHEKLGTPRSRSGRNGEKKRWSASLETARFLIKVGSRLARRAVRDTCMKERWFLAYMMKDFDPTSGIVPNPSYMMPPKDRFWADPFPWVRDGKYYVFLEEFLYDKKKAHISVMEMNSSGHWSVPRKVLECPYHLSYPFVFEWHDHLYMIPETKKNNCVALFRCEEFPMKWSLDRVLVENVQAVDATLHQYEGLWWLFCNIGGTYFPSNDELYLFYAETPLGPWHPHKFNPVKTEVRSSRPAGRLFSKDGQLYRPSQDCSVRMGGAIVVNRVVRLSTEEFDEEEVSRIDPSWKRGLYGVHTLNRADQLTMLDCFGYVRKST